MIESKVRYVRTTENTVPTKTTELQRAPRTQRKKEISIWSFRVIQTDAR